MAGEIPIAIIGGGVVGCAVARELSLHYKGIFLFEKNPGITRGENQSSRNSGVIHSGIYYDKKICPQKAELCVLGNRLIYDFCNRYRVPALKTGKLIVATSPAEEETLENYWDRAGENHVEGVEKISGSKVRELEPNIRANSALLIPSTGIIDPTSLVYRLQTLASKKGVRFLTDTEVIGLEGKGDLDQLTFRYNDGRIDQVRAKVIINAAGIDADRLARLLNPQSPYEVDPVRGESYKFYGHKRPELHLNGMSIYPTPEYIITPHGHHFTVGIHLTPTFQALSFPATLGSTVTVGPKLVPVENKNVRIDAPSVDAKIFSRKVSSFFPGIRNEDLIWHQAGVQARLKGHFDFVIMSDPNRPNFINLLGIDSPGLTSSLAIARQVKGMVDKLTILTDS